MTMLLLPNNMKYTRKMNGSGSQKEVICMPEKRKIGTYTVVQSFEIGNTEMLLVEDTNRVTGRYGVAKVPTIPATLDGDPEFIASGTEYLPILGEYANAIQQEVQQVQAQRNRLDVPEGIIDPTDLRRIDDVNLEGKLICLYPGRLMPIYRTQAYQVVLAESGFGCSPDCKDGNIYGTNVATGNRVKFSRGDIQGVFEPGFLPRWLELKLAAPSYLRDRKTDTWQHLKTLRFVCPLHASIYPGEYSDYNGPTELGGSVSQFKKEILQAIENDKLPGEEARGLMTYYRPKEDNAVEQSIASKVWSYFPTVEVIGKESSDQLYGVIECHLKEALTNEELEVFKRILSEQLSSRWGEDFKQMPIDTDDGELYVSFWSPDGSWALTEESVFRNAMTQQGVQLQ